MSNLNGQGVTPPTTPQDQSITIYEDWDEIDGVIWYKWKRADEDSPAEEGEWHYIRTAFKQKPVIRWKSMSEVEYKEKLLLPAESEPQSSPTQTTPVKEEKL